MIEQIVTIVLWSLITFVLLVDGGITLECAYIGMCVMLAAGLLRKEE